MSSHHHAIMSVEASQETCCVLNSETRIQFRSKTVMEIEGRQAETGDVWVSLSLDISFARLSVYQGVRWRTESVSLEEH